MDPQLVELGIYDCSVCHPVFECFLGESKRFLSHKNCKISVSSFVKMHEPERLRSLKPYLKSRFFDHLSCSKLYIISHLGSGWNYKTMYQLPTDMSNVSLRKTTYKATFRIVSCAVFSKISTSFHRISRDRWSVCVENSV